LDGKFKPSVMSLFRGPFQSKQEVTIAWQTETFWCITTSPGLAPMIEATRLPTVTGISHQPSSQARIPREAHVSANCWSDSAVRRGMAPSE